MSKTKWPTEDQVTQAMLHPAITLSDPQLRKWVTVLNTDLSYRWPAILPGNFAWVFQLRDPRNGRTCAVRCFKRFVSDRDKRYAEISDHLKRVSLPCFPSFDYHAKGILLSGDRFPILAMEWVDGLTLDQHIGKLLNGVSRTNHSVRRSLNMLAQRWKITLALLRSAEIAHGDLQHLNIIVRPDGTFCLVDLDGMFVPRLAHLHSIEVGLEHYQHKERRNKHFDSNIDNFAGLVIYTSLLALAEQPQLWKEFHGDQNLIFRREDFIDPSSSILLNRVKAIGGHPAALARNLERACKLTDPLKVPSLLEFDTNSPLESGLSFAGRLTWHGVEKVLDGIVWSLKYRVSRALVRANGIPWRRIGQFFYRTVNTLKAQLRNLWRRNSGIPVRSGRRPLDQSFHHRWISPQIANIGMALVGAAAVFVFIEVGYRLSSAWTAPARVTTGALPKVNQVPPTGYQLPGIKELVTVHPLETALALVGLLIAWKLVKAGRRRLRTLNLQAAAYVLMLLGLSIITFSVFTQWDVTGKLQAADKTIVEFVKTSLSAAETQPIAETPHSPEVPVPQTVPRVPVEPERPPNEEKAAVELVPPKDGEICEEVEFHQWSADERLRKKRDPMTWWQSDRIGSLPVGKKVTMLRTLGDEVQVSTIFTNTTVKDGLFTGWVLSPAVATSCDAQRSERAAGSGPDNPPDAEKQQQDASEPGISADNKSGREGGTSPNRSVGDSPTPGQPQVILSPNPYDVSSPSLPETGGLSASNGSPVPSAPNDWRRFSREESTFPRHWRLDRSNEFFDFQFNGDRLTIYRNNLTIGDLTLKRDKNGVPARYEGVANQPDCRGGRGAIQVVTWSRIRIEARLEEPRDRRLPICGGLKGVLTQDSIPLSSLLGRKWRKMTFVPAER